jgi:hypothetical protein
MMHQAFTGAARAAPSSSRITTMAQIMTCLISGKDNQHKGSLPTEAA